MNYFQDVDTIEKAKSVYRELLMKFHPDHGGDEELTKEIINQFEKFLATFVNASFMGFEKERGFKPKAHSEAFADILKDIIKFNMTIEIIGYWIYCFNSYEYRQQLKDLGFWFSKKHKAWVFSGMKKRNIRTGHTTDSIKSMWGVDHIRDKEERMEIA